MVTRPCFEAQSDRFERIIDAYSDRWRFYHTTEHIKDLITKIKEYIDGLKISSELGFSKLFLYLATFFHDIVYIPQRKDNELNSALIFDEFIAHSGADEYFSNFDDFSKSVPKRIYNLIIMTAKHLSDHGLEQNSLEQIFLDIDMSIVASEWETYRDYAEAVRQEYSHFNDKDFCSGRSHFLKGLLGVPIFKSEIFGSEVNTKAWENIQRESSELELKLAGIIGQGLDL